MKQLKTRLRDQRDDHPTPVYIWYGKGMTSREALAAAIAAGMVPEHAAIVLLPQKYSSHEEWTADAQADYERRRAAEQQQATEAGIVPAGHS